MVAEKNYGRLSVVMVSLMLAIVTLFIVTQTLAAEGADPNTLDGSSKSVSAESAAPGDALDYTITISNSGGVVTNVLLVDALPSALTLSGAVMVTGTGDLGLVVTDSNTITWTGDVAMGTVSLLFTAVVDSELEMTQTVTNTAMISSSLGMVMPSATTEIVVPEGPTTTTLYLPLVFRSPVMLTGLFASRPNAANDWAIFWDSTGDGTVQIQESRSESFDSILNTYEVASTATSLTINTNEPSPNNAYFYRARIVVNGNAGEWSDTVEVTGAYYDDFSNDNTGWAIRRTTFIEEVRTFYENNDWLIMQSEDSWDWGISAPYRKAPLPPYVIEYRSKVANLGNLVSQGLVFGADWPVEECPNYDTLEGVYEHTRCFNQYYNLNTIWFGPMKMLFERVDRQVWCPSDPGCPDSGSPMKRGGDTMLRDPIPNVKPNDWNTWRVEVRESGIQIFANGNRFMVYDDTRYINNPYFGFFASTDEYSNSTGRFDYIRITPLNE